MSNLTCLHVQFVLTLTRSYFNKYSGGSPTITDEDFARILLRHTAWDMDPVLQRLRRTPEKANTAVYFERIGLVLLMVFL